jgi:hypothetical protein
MEWAEAIVTPAEAEYEFAAAGIVASTPDRTIASTVRCDTDAAAH